MGIVQDVENWIDVLHHVYGGGPRVKGEYEPNARWEHEDVAAVKAADIARSESTHAHSIGTES